MRRILSVVCLLAIATSLVLADLSSLPLGATIKRFVLPSRNANGELVSQITGETATAVSTNRTEIVGLRIELYEAGKVGTVITSPKSDLWNSENRLSTQSGVLINRADVQISAQNMEWDMKEQRGVFRQQVKVVVDKLDFGAKPPATAN